MECNYTTITFKLRRIGCVTTQCTTWMIYFSLNYLTDRLLCPRLCAWFVGRFLRATNSLWPSDVVWGRRSWSTLFQATARCLVASSHYLTQLWLNVSEVFWHPSEKNFKTVYPAVVAYKGRWHITSLSFFNQNKPTSFYVEISSMTIMVLYVFNFTDCLDSLYPKYGVNTKLYVALLVLI